ncbi:MAG: hypothetical protein WBR18_09205 [Anaerolineales bacterium]
MDARLPGKKGWLVTGFGLLLFSGMMAAGYLYNVTFIQLGLTDLGERVLSLSPTAVATRMAGFAVVTCTVALVFGWWMTRSGRGADFRWKAKAALAVLSVQALLTACVLAVDSAGEMSAWLLAAGAAMGAAVPVTFALTVDFVPVAARGWTAGLITATAYLSANLLPADWRIEVLAKDMLILMPLGLLLTAGLAFVRHPWIDQWANQHRDPSFGRGRYLPSAGHSRFPLRLLAVIAIMFAAFFIDSLGFLRLLDSPTHMLSAWQSNEPGVRLALGGVHVLGAAIGAVFYSYLDDKTLYLSIFGLFGLTHLLYTMAARSTGTPALAMPMLYALAVSMYTVVTFALWADVSTPKTIGVRAAVGVALSGWTATFLSTALALRWIEAGLPLTRHLQWVDAGAVLLFLSMILVIYFARSASPVNPKRGHI